MGFLNKIPEWLKFIIKLLITLIALAFVISKIEFNQVINIISDSNWWLFFPATAFFVFSKIISSIRLNHFFLNINIPITNKKNLKLYWLGMFYNLFLPGGIGGDGYKIFLLKNKFDIGAKNIFFGVLLDRISGLIALISLSIFLTIFLPLDKLFILLLLFTIPIIFFTYYKIISKYFSAFTKSFKKTNILSFLIQFSQLIAVLFIIWALRIENSIEIYLFIFLISSVVATIPFTVGGVGARELTFFYSATWLNINSEAAISISFLFFIITALVSLYGIRYNLDKNFEKQLNISKDKEH